MLRNFVLKDGSTMGFSNLNLHSNSLLSMFVPLFSIKFALFPRNIIPLVYVSFDISLQGGPRICLGKDFAYRQMKIVAMALLRFFRFKLANETQNVTYRVMFTLHIDKGLPLYAVQRS